MDSCKAFKTEVADIESTWQLFIPFQYCQDYKNIYLRKIRRIRLSCRVIHKLRTYKKPILEAIEIISEGLSHNTIQIINTINTYQKPIFSLKIKCKIQINDWTLDLLGLIDTGCSNTIIDQKLVPFKYHKPIPTNSQFRAKRMDGQLFTCTTKLDKGKPSFYLPNGTLTNYINIEHKINLRHLQL